MEQPVDGELDVVEDEGGGPDEDLVEADLPPSHDAEDSVQPAPGEEVD